MTTEEINKAAEEYATKLDVSTFDYKAARKDFREGADFVNKHWQEKTRWKSLETEPPKYEGQNYQVLVRFAPGIYDVVCIIRLRSIERAIAAGYKDWKEIE